MPDHSKMKLGRKAIKTDTRTLLLGDYLKPGLPKPPAQADWTKGIESWGMLLNNKLGDCTIAGVAHAIQVWTANNGKMAKVSNNTVQSYYEKWDGYVPGNPKTDNGGIELDVLNQWRKQGFAGTSLAAFAVPHATNVKMVRQAIALFGGVYIGLDLPLSCQTQAVWDVAPKAGAKAKAGSWGGHCVFVPKYDAESFTCITWGQLKKMTIPFWKRYCNEAYALLCPDWIAAKGSPSGFNMAQLEADLKAIV